MQKNIVLNMMKVRENHSIFKEARINLILESRDTPYYGCAVKIDYEMKRRSNEF